MGGLSHTVSGDIASFRTPSRVPIESLKFHFLPKQASGTPSPENPIPIEGWTGFNRWRFGKNLINFTAKTSDNLGVLWVENEYGVVEFEGTPTSWSSIMLGTVKLNGITKLYGKIFGDEANVAFNSLYVFDSNGNRLAVIGSPWESSTHDDNYVEIDLSDYSTADYVEIRLKRNLNKYMKGKVYTVVTDDLKFLKTSITFPTNGKNLVNDETTTLKNWTTKDGHRYISTNTDTRDSVSMYVVQYGSNDVVLKNNVKYTPVVIGRNSLTIDVVKGCTKILLKHNGVVRDFGVFIPWDGRVGTYTISANFESIDLSTVGGFIFSDVQIELGDTMTSYEPYSSDNTFYGGYVDPVAGEIVATCKKINLKNRAWYYYTTNQFALNIDKKLLSDTVFCDMLPISKINAYPTDDKSIGFWGNGASYANIIFIKYEASNNVNDFKAWLNSLENDPCLIYELAIPIHIPIPAEDLQAFLDHNNFWSDANDITEVTYAVTESKDILDARKLIMDGSQPHLEDASGAIASFSTDMKAPVKELKAYFTPVQEGSGDASPENERPIHGFKGLLLHRDGKNIIDLQSATWSGDSSKVSYSISGGDVTITAKMSGRVGFVGSQYMIKQNVPYAWLGKKVYFGCSDVIHNNPEHICTVVVEFRDETGTRITDPTVITTNDGTKARSFTIPSNTKEFVIMFRIAQNCGTVDVNSGDYVTFKDFYIRYPADVALYEPYDGETIPIEFPATKNLLDTSKVLKNIGGATFSYSEGSWSFENCGSGNGSAVWGSQVFPAGTYTIKATPSREGVRGFRLLCSSASCGGQWLDWYEGYFIDSSNGTDKITFTTTESFKVGLCFLNNSQHLSSPGTLKCIQLERGSNATIYEPYGIVYGGYVDLIRGKLIAKWCGSSVLWKDIKNARYSSTTDQREGRLYFPYPLYKASTPGSGAAEKAICNVAKWVYADISYQSTGHFYVSGGFNDGEHVAYIILPESTSDDTVITVVAEMVTPIEYDLTPQQIKTLKGLNNIWHDANGETEVKYWTH